MRDTAPLRSRNLLRVTLESLPAPVIVLDGQARIRYANQAARRFAGHALTVREAYHLPFVDYVSALDPGHPADELRTVVAAVQASGRLLVKALQGLRQVRVTELDTNDRRAGYVVIVWPHREPDGDDDGAQATMVRAVDTAQRGLAAARQALDEISEIGSAPTTHS